jgi:phospholipid/cholesterol/gamma-HCH transport system ATP-binding protein
MSLIELQRVSRSFGRQPVLRDISLEVRAGETLVLIGESGCGKSVTMKLMMDLLQPTSGEVLWEGKPVRARSEKQITRERLKFGYLFQQAALFDSLTVFENVAFGLRQNAGVQPSGGNTKKSRVTRLSENDIRRIVHDRLRDVGLSADVVGEKKPAELSGGMRKRVGLARALAMSPEIMLYDEPTTGLDPIMSDVINELILRTHDREQMTSVVVTHDMHTVEKVADRIVMFYPLARLQPDEPQIIFEGTAEQAFASNDTRVYQFVRGEAGERLIELAAA